MCNPQSFENIILKTCYFFERKYSTNDRLVYTACDSVDEVIELIVNKEGLNKEFKPNDYNYLLFLNIIAKSAFGKKFKNNISYSRFQRFIFPTLHIGIRLKMKNSKISSM